jgi:hypothetical protein
VGLRPLLENHLNPGIRYGWGALTQFFSLKDSVLFRQ